MVSDDFNHAEKLSATALVTSGKSGSLQLLTMGKVPSGWYLACVTEATIVADARKFVGRGETPSEACADAIKCYRQGADATEFLRQAATVSINPDEEKEAPLIISN